ncbi:response regulator [Pseudonocardia humida]|uniref:Response regulator transcription factor n=1 Tax=Pseudonocardia humida TaxID=2800819 RepID=A0ABT0ZU88_9PSEU|nr:response regulator transcription factor [Pseudonocardia humida]MCO1654292.1 response regulator transcription factor [Pseudonocardia humida]
MIRVLVADDQEAVRDGLAMLLGAEPDIDVVGAAVDGADLVALARRRRPDVVLTDIRMPRMDGVAAIRRLVALDPAPAVIALTTFDTDEHLFGALQAGAVGFLLKDGDDELFARAVRTAHAGGGLIDPQVTPRLVHRFATTSPRPPGRELDRLTDRETEVLRCLGFGHSNARIAELLAVSPGTVKVHVERVLAKLGLSGRVQAALYAHRHGLLTWADRDPADPAGES